MLIWQYFAPRSYNIIARVLGFVITADGRRD